MKLHANARTCPKSRRLMVDRVGAGWSLAEAAEAAGVSERTAAKWMARWRAEGAAGLVDRSSAPRRVPGRTPRLREEAIVALRRLRMTAAEIAELLSMALSTVSAVLRRAGLGKLSRLDPPEPEELQAGLTFIREQAARISKGGSPNVQMLPEPMSRACPPPDRVQETARFRRWSPHTWPSYRCPDCSDSWRLPGGPTAGCRRRQA